LLEVPRQPADQRLTDARPQGGGIHREAPETGAIVRIVENRTVIDARHRAQHLLALGIDGDQKYEFVRIALAPDEIAVRGHHVALEIEVVDRLGLDLPGYAPDLDGGPIGVRLEAGEIEAQHVRGIQKQLLGCIGQHHVRIADIGRDIALPRPLADHFLGDLLGCLEGLGKDHPPPAAVQRNLLRHRGPPRGRPSQWSRFPGPGASFPASRSARVLTLAAA